MKRIPLLVLLLLVSCQELAAPAKLSPGSSTLNNNYELSDDLLDGPWKRNYQACDLSNTNCTDVDIVVSFASENEIHINGYYAGTMNPFPINRTFEVEDFVSNNEFTMFETAYGVNAPRLHMKYKISGDVLRLCEDGMCYNYNRI